MNAYLLLPDGQRVPVADGLIIGREDGCDVRLTDPKASRQHARIIVEAAVAEVEDLESSNGTRLNGKVIRRRVLRAGDVIQIGTSLIAYREEETAGKEPGADPDQPPPPPVEVIEFADERVEVKATRVMSAPAGGHPRARTSTAGGILGDDLRQMGGTRRTLVVVLVLVAAAALGYIAMRVVAG